MKNENFYNAVSPFYDSMISFEKSLEKRKQFYQKIFGNENISAVADLGCGSGLDSLALAGIGLTVTGFDPSSQMIKSAKQNALKLKEDIKFYKKGILDIPTKFNSKFDCVVSFGNTLANISAAELPPSIQKINSVLKPSGLLILQIINYTNYLSGGDKVFGYKETGDEAIVRFYEKWGGELVFHILRLNKKKVVDSIHLKTVIYPHTPRFIKKSLAQNGFKILKVYGGINLEKFDEQKSNDFLLVAKKTN